MPRPAAPPTPQPSSEIASKTEVHNAGQFDNFALPPAAMPTATNSSRDSSCSSTTSNASDSSYHPMSPPSTSHSAKAPGSATRKRSIAVVQATEADSGYSLPPPPTRSRKIIQMKPKGQTQQLQPAQVAAKEEPATASTAAGNAKGGAGAAGGRKKQANGTTAAGRKIARKTAHSLIERRRRSKMNEEFGILKNMIPACAGHEMHKLAILQASIEYMRYLEKCVADLKASHAQNSSSRKSRRHTPIDSRNTSPAPQPNNQDNTPASSDDEDEDEDMSDAVSPTTIPKTLQPSPALTRHSATTSPAIYPADRSSVAYPPYSSHTSPAIQPSDPRHYSITSSIRSTATSPAIHPSPSILPSPAYSTHVPTFPSTSTASSGRFSLTSPALQPTDDVIRDSGKDAEREREDHEATAALLMLNSDRRSWNGKALGVRDLFSS